MSSAADDLDAAAARVASKRRRELAWLAGIVLIALAVRVVFVLQMRASPLFDAPQMDAKYHVDWARAFERGETFQTGPFFRAPLYPWFLGACFELFGPSLLVPRLIQALFGAATVALVYGIGARLYGARVAKLAAAAAALSWVLVFYDGELLLETLATPLNLLALWFFLRARDEGRARDWAGAGLALGLAAIARPNILLVGLALAAVWLLVERRRWRGALRSLAVTGLAAAAPILPITLHNGLVGGDWVLISSQAGVNLWIGNNPQADGVTAIVPGTRADWWGGYHDAIALAESAEGRTLRPSEVSRHYTRRALEFWRNRPEDALALLARKVRLLGVDWEIGNNEEPSFLAHTFAPISRWLPYSFAVVGALAWLGLFGSRARRHWPLWGFVLAYGAGVVAFFVCSRYRAPLVPVLLIAAARGVEWTIECVRARRLAPLVPAAIVAAASLVLSFRPPAGLATSGANGHLAVGVAELAAGRTDAAVERFRAALALDASNWIARRELAFALRTRGELDGAEAEYRAVLAAHPDDTTALEGLAELLLARGRAGEAAEVARRLLAAAPFDARGDYALGRAHYAARDLAAARASFLEALAKDPTAFNPAYALAMLDREAGDSEAAIAALRRALASPRAGEAPMFELAAWVQVIELQRGLADLAGARASFEAARRRFPDAPEIQALESLLR